MEFTRIGRCECLFRYEKKLFSSLLDEKIKETEAMLERARGVDKEKAPDLARMAESLGPAVLEEFKAVMTALQAIPECDE